jgi:hypothetical protein
MANLRMAGQALGRINREGQGPLIPGELDPRGRVPLAPGFAGENFDPNAPNIFPVGRPQRHNRAGDYIFPIGTGVSAPQQQQQYRPAPQQQQYQPAPRRQGPIDYSGYGG